MSNLYRGLSIDDSYQVLVHLACKSANQKHELPVMAMSVYTNEPFSIIFVVTVDICFNFFSN
jgi:hypothetical protein